MSWSMLKGFPLTVGGCERAFRNGSIEQHDLVPRVSHIIAPWCERGGTQAGSGHVRPRICCSECGLSKRKFVANVNLVFFSVSSSVLLCVMISFVP